MKEMEPVLQASVINGYMLMPHDFQKLYNDVDDDESKKVVHECYRLYVQPAVNLFCRLSCNFYCVLTSQLPFKFMVPIETGDKCR